MKIPKKKKSVCVSYSIFFNLHVNLYMLTVSVLLTLSLNFPDMCHNLDTLLNHLQIAYGNCHVYFLIFFVGQCRLRKYWLKGEKAGTSEVMAILPGFPDNVRTNEKGEFWVAIHCRRTMYSHLSGLYPTVRKFLLKLPIPSRIQYLLQIGGRPHAVVVKYSPEGKLLQILEDGQGKVVKAVSAVEEKDGKLWMGSVLMPFVAVYQL